MQQVNPTTPCPDPPQTCGTQATALIGGLQAPAVALAPARGMEIPGQQLPNGWNRLVVAAGPHNDEAKQFILGRDQDGVRVGAIAEPRRPFLGSTLNGEALEDLGWKQTGVARSPGRDVHRRNPGRIR